MVLVGLALRLGPDFSRFGHKDLIQKMSIGV